MIDQYEKPTIEEDRLANLQGTYKETRLKLTAFSLVERSSSQLAFAPVDKTRTREAAMKLFVTSRENERESVRMREIRADRPLNSETRGEK